MTQMVFVLVPLHRDCKCDLSWLIRVLWFSFRHDSFCLFASFLAVIALILASWSLLIIHSACLQQSCISKLSGFPYNLISPLLFLPCCDSSRSFLAAVPTSRHVFIFFILIFSLLKGTLFHFCSSFHHLQVQYYTYIYITLFAADTILHTRWYSKIPSAKPAVKGVCDICMMIEKHLVKRWHYTSWIDPPCSQWQSLYTSESL